jgi:hypothetical protein
VLYIVRCFFNVRVLLKKDKFVNSTSGVGRKKVELKTCRPRDDFHAGRSRRQKAVLGRDMRPYRVVTTSTTRTPVPGSVHTCPARIGRKSSKSDLSRLDPVSISSALFFPHQFVSSALPCHLGGQYSFALAIFSCCAPMHDAGVETCKFPSVQVRVLLTSFSCRDRPLLIARCLQVGHHLNFPRRRHGSWPPFFSLMADVRRARFTYVGRPGHPIEPDTIILIKRSIEIYTPQILEHKSTTTNSD